MDGAGAWKLKRMMQDSPLFSRVANRDLDAGQTHFPKVAS